MMIDYIRNAGELCDYQLSQRDMLKMELRYWGIDENLFQQRRKDKFQLIQETFDKPVHELFRQKDEEGNDFFFKYLRHSKLDFKDLYNKGKFKFKDDFRIRRIKELIEIEYGQEFKQNTEIGRICVLDFDKSDK